MSSLYRPHRTRTHDLAWKDGRRGRFNGRSSSGTRDILRIVEVWEGGHAFRISKGLVASMYTLCGTAERYWHLSPRFSKNDRQKWAIFSEGVNG